jgi:hypothetical protein
MALYTIKRKIPVIWLVERKNSFPATEYTGAAGALHSIFCDPIRIQTIQTGKVPSHQIRQHELRRRSPEQVSTTSIPLGDLFFGRLSFLRRLQSILGPLHRRHGIVIVLVDEKSGLEIEEGLVPLT